MNFRALAIALRATALLLALATVGTWAATGAHLGWTQTSAVEIRQDEITGIEYPVRHSVFIAGVDALAAGLASAVALSALSLIQVRRRRTAAV